jgi:2-(1,2-epoxy-1,2-dihydrophenyl)acetyl-CoA isomerase
MGARDRPARLGGPLVSVLIDATDDILSVRFDRPERKNALDMATLRLVIEALEAAATDDALRVVLLSGSGGDFCSGADWVSTNKAAAGERPRTGSIQRRLPLQAHRLIELLMEIQLPVVCAVRGWAAGLGFQMALAADFTIASEQACFWEPFLERGFSPDTGSTWLLPRLVGIARAKEILLLGRKLSGREAAEWGLIMQAVPDGELDGAIQAIVDRLSNAPTVAFGLAKRGLHRALETGLTEAMETESTALELTSRSGDFKEGLAAFSERRPPNFQGV